MTFSAKERERVRKSSIMLVIFALQNTKIMIDNETIAIGLFKSSVDELTQLGAKCVGVNLTRELRMYLIIIRVTCVMQLKSF